MALLSFEAATRCHRVGRETVVLLDDVSFEVWPGEVVAILGPRRAGKTTLLRIAAGIERCDAGVVRLGDQDLRALPATERTRRLRAVGFAPKDWRAAQGKPILDHVALPLLADGTPLTTAMARAQEALEQVGAGELSDARAEDLGAGELSRIALARALVRSPLLLLVDEPGALAEPAERDALLQLLHAIAAARPQLALVVTGRDVAGVNGASRVLRLGDGRLRGTTAPAPAKVLPFRGRVAPGAAPAP